VDVVGIEIVGVALTMLCGVGVSFTLFRLRAHDRRAAARERALIAAVRDEIQAVSGFLARAPHALTASAPAHRGLQRLPVVKVPPIVHRIVDAPRDADTPPGALVTVEFSSDERFDSTGGRWLDQVMNASRTASALPSDDTPPPPGQRTPVLPPPSSSGLRHRR
jgi:hypothetical protein